MANSIKMHRGVFDICVRQNYVTCTRNGELARRPVSGYMFMYEGRAYGVHKAENGYWVVTDRESGLMVCSDTTRGGAVDKLVYVFIVPLYRAIQKPGYAKSVLEFTTAGAYVTDEQAIKAALAK